ncbi:short-chain dehydrogenase/reductase SDR (plasmid) [Nocardioides sp. JS614]|nr:short-chain dehydrogenase/reductase SDR [Nocardioides sp. JS614]
MGFTTCHAPPEVVMDSKLFALDGRVALVTGGNGGLGRAIALALRDAGATVAVTGRDERKNAAVAADLGSADAVFPGDVRDESAVSATMAQVVERFGRLDILVNNAGNYVGGSVLDLTESGWHAVVDTHLTGSFLCAKHAAQVMVSQRSGGKIINIGSMYSLFGPPAAIGYAAAKTGIIGLTRALAVELAEHDIQVNAILPGWYETDLTRGAPGSEWGERIRHKTPAQRWGDTDDLAGPAVFLASTASDFVTGVALPVDGGYAVADRLLPE